MSQAIILMVILYSVSQYSYVNGDWYEGEWMNGVMHGGKDGWFQTVCFQGRPAQ